MLRGREIHIGIGRGSSPREFRYLQIDQNDARERFKESVDILRLAFDEEEFSYEGKHFKVSGVTTRPRPRSAGLGSRMYGAIASQASLEIVAEMGLDLMCTGGASVEAMTENCTVFDRARARVGLGPSRPIVGVPGYCAPTHAAAAEVAERTFATYLAGAERHYGFNDRQQFAGIKGYEHYSAAGGQHVLGESPTQGYIQSGVYGTPDECIDKIRMYKEVTGTDHILLLHSMGGMSVEQTEASLRLFSDEVLPVVRDDRDPAPAAAATAAGPV
jgi:alkanesulfonate monooxygenase SsuD/methylene tetrahydromethanopterin reductase-like flavin-dependent oxidoreductase (luciferase family)